MLKPHENQTLMEVGPGTPMGELLRRYWMPIAPVAELDDQPTKAVRLFGEDLVLYKDKSGTYGLIDRHCPHRRADMSYGFVEVCGLRCNYHGWLFDTSGKCLDQPCEPKESTYKDRVRQPWYPCREYLGLVFAYFGPLDRLPAFPRFDILEEGEGAVLADGTSYGLGGGEVLDCNWLQIYENVMDPFHVFVLRLLPEPAPVLAAGGMALVLIGLWIVTMTFATNAFAVPVVKTQVDRHHHVVDRGPYARVRHPMYAGFIPMSLGTPLLLGSWYGFALAFLLVAIMAVRAVLEENTLKAELEGYAAYAARVRYRLVPGVW